MGTLATADKIRLSDELKGWTLQQILFSTDGGLLCVFEHHMDPVKVLKIKNNYYTDIHIMPPVEDYRSMVMTDQEATNEQD